MNSLVVSCHIFGTLTVVMHEHVDYSYDIHYGVISCNIRHYSLCCVYNCDQCFPAFEKSEHHASRDIAIAI